MAMGIYQRYRHLQHTAEGVQKRRAAVQAVFYRATLRPQSRQAVKRGNHLPSILLKPPINTFLLRG